MADEIGEIRLFVEIVKAGNLSAAARSTSSSTSAMSRALGALESRLGVLLATRTSRSFELTEEGQRFYDRCVKILEDLADAEADASSRSESVKGRIRISAPMELGRRFIGPLVADFTAQFPEVEIHLKLTDSGVSVIDAGLDVSLRVGLPPDSSLIAKKLLTAQRIVCASPAYIEQYGAPQHPTDLRDHDCIRLVRGRRLLDAWEFQEDGRRFKVTVSGRLTSTSGELVHDWARAGRGIGLEAYWDLQPDLADGALVQCLKEYWCDEISLYAMFVSESRISPRVDAFLNFLSANLRNKFGNLAAE